MRKLVVLFVVMLAVTNVAMLDVYAQNVNTDKIVAKYNKLEAAINNPKKSGDAELWMEYAQASVEAAKCITENLSLGTSFDVVYISLGNYEKREETQLSGQKIVIYKYPFVDVYVASNNHIIGWQAKSVVAGKDLYREALNSLNRVYKLNSMMKNSVAKELATISLNCAINANANFQIGAYLEASNGFMIAYEAQKSPAYNGSKNYEYLYNAAYLLTAGVNTQESRDAAISMWRELLNEEYEHSGDVYYYLGFCYYFADGSSVDAIKVAYDGAIRYPKNEALCEMASAIFTKYDFSNIDYEKYIKVVEGMIQSHPQNYNIGYTRGCLYYKLSKYDEAITSFKKCVEIKPDNANLWFMIGSMYLNKGESLSEELNEASDMEKYNAILKQMNDNYRESFQYFEKAYLLGYQNKSIISTLKSIAYRFKEEPGMMDKYEKYRNLE